MPSGSQTSHTVSFNILLKKFFSMSSKISRRVRSNLLTNLPEINSCLELVQVDFGLNKIRAISESPFEFLSKLQDLLLDRNELTSVSSEAFLGLQNLQILWVSVANSLCYFKLLLFLKTWKLYPSSYLLLETKWSWGVLLLIKSIFRDLEKNNISHIHEDAFLPLNNLKDL